MALDLKYDHNINGNEFKAGDKVDTNGTLTDADGKVSKHDFADQLKEQEAAMDEARTEAATHHGEAPTNDDPNEVTEQTPTRPLPNGPDASDPKGDKK